MAYAEAEKSAATRAAYASDWRDFTAWCASRGATALPAHQGIVAAYLSWLAGSGRKASTIGRRAAAIGYHHKMAGHEPPTNREGGEGGPSRHPPHHRQRQGGQGAAVTTSSISRRRPARASGTEREWGESPITRDRPWL